MHENPLPECMLTMLVRAAPGVLWLGALSGRLCGAFWLWLAACNAQLIHVARCGTHAVRP